MTFNIVGRRSSHFTRLALIYAETLQIAYEFVPVFDMTALDATSYASNPALKLPILQRGDATLFGAGNICRALAEAAPAHRPALIWPEQLQDDLSRNAQELVWHCMAAQVQLVMGTVVGKLPIENVYFAKTKAGLENSLAWLDRRLQQTLRVLPQPRELSLLEASLFCLIEHVAWRGTLATDCYSSLTAFAQDFSTRPAAARTGYRFDVAPNAVR